jgi:hypothetical protein
VANPRSFAVLCFRHLREFYFPDRWELYFSGWSGMAGARAALMSLIDLLGLIGLIFALYRRQPLLGGALTLGLAALALFFG